jgi:hypothetical protein
MIILFLFFLNLRFGLNENETISFDEFASRFENNQVKIKKIDINFKTSQNYSIFVSVFK